MKATTLSGIGLTVILFYVATDAATFQPFVRSRYSIRKRITTAIVPTENPDIKLIESSSAYSQHVADVDSNAELYGTTTSTSWPLNSKDISQEQAVDPLKPQTELPLTSKISTTEYVRGKSSTPPADYDYYGNGENEDLEVNERL